MHSIIPDIAKGTKLLLIDDDPIYRNIMKINATNLNVELEAFESVAEMGTFARIKNFAAALIDYNLEHLNGIEIAEYIDTFFSEIPVIIVTSGDISKIVNLKWPECIKSIRSKTCSPKALIEEACHYIDRINFLKKYESNVFYTQTEKIAE